MARKVNLDQFTIDELRRMLIEKRRSERQSRLEHFRKTGRLVVVEQDYQPELIQNLQTEVLPEFNDVEKGISKSDQRKRRKVWVDRFLLLVEVFAVIGLIFVLLNGFNILRTINEEAVQSFELATPTPTAIIRAVVLPSGHTPPDATGKTRPNESEIPEHLRPLVQSLADIPIPTPSVEHARQIQIPAILVDAPVVQGDGWEQLKQGVGQHIGSPNPGEKGNLILSAHNDIFGEIFKNLDQLKPGDRVILYTSQKAYNYVVSGTQIVLPTQVEVLAPTENATLTLISCYPYLIDNKRIVVTAILEENP